MQVACLYPTSLLSLYSGGFFTPSAIYWRPRRPSNLSKQQALVAVRLFHHGGSVLLLTLPSHPVPSSRLHELDFILKENNSYETV